MKSKRVMLRGLIIATFLCTILYSSQWILHKVLSIRPDVATKIFTNIFFMFSYPTNFILNIIYPCQGLQCIGRLLYSPIIIIILAYIYGILIYLIYRTFKKFLIRKVILLFLVTLITLFIILVIYLGFINTSSKVCELDGDQGIKNSCIRGFAIKMNNTSLCDDFGDGFYEYQCKAEVTGDITYCQTGPFNETANMNPDSINYCGMCSIKKWSYHPDFNREKELCLYFVSKD